MSEKVALVRSINDAAVDIFERHDFEVVRFDKTDDPQEFSAGLQGASIVGVRSEGVPGGVLELNPQIAAIGCYCVGTKVDFHAAGEQGVAIFNSVHENTRSVAEHVITSIGNLFRRTSEHSGELHGGTWTKTDKRSYEIRRKTLGIIGYGNIGIQVSVMAEALGMDVLYYDPFTRLPGLGRAQRLHSREELLAKSDVVTLHVPVTDQTEHMINADTIAGMKKGSYIINAARGELVDYNAVKEALDSEQLGGVAVDVYVDEPKREGDDFDHPLRGVKSALLTPHIAGSTQEAQSSIAVNTSGKLVDFWKSGNAMESVNLPPLALADPPEGTSRILWPHANVPGATASIANVLAEANINIGPQASDVKKNIGYAYFDIAGTIPQGVIDTIKQLHETRRLRIIQANN